MSKKIGLVTSKGFIPPEIVPQKNLLWSSESGSAEVLIDTDLNQTIEVLVGAPQSNGGIYYYPPYRVKSMAVCDVINAGADYTDILRINHYTTKISIEVNRYSGGSSTNKTDSYKIYEIWEIKD